MSKNKLNEQLNAFYEQIRTLVHYLKDNNIKDYSVSMLVLKDSLHLRLERHKQDMACLEVLDKWVEGFVDEDGKSAEETVDVDPIENKDEKDSTLPAYIRLQAAFPDFSYDKIMQLKEQMPDATEIRTFDEWKVLGANILKKSKAIKIFHDSSEPDSKYENYFDISQTTYASKSKPKHYILNHLNGLIRCFGYTAALNHDITLKDPFIIDETEKRIVINGSLPEEDLLRFLLNYCFNRYEQPEHIVKARDKSMYARLLTSMYFTRYGFKNDEDKNLIAWFDAQTEEEQRSFLETMQPVFNAFVNRADLSAGADNEKIAEDEVS
jgi:hypothetical protein